MCLSQETVCQDAKEQLARAHEQLECLRQQHVQDEAAQAGEISQLQQDLAASWAHAEMQQDSLQQLQLKMAAEAAQVEVKS